MKTQITEQTLAFRPIGFKVHSTPDGFVLALRCHGEAEDDRSITTINLHCPAWWWRVLDMMSEAISNLKPHTPQPEKGKPNGHERSSTRRSRTDGAGSGDSHNRTAQG